MIINKITKKIIVIAEVFILWYISYILLNKDCLPNPVKTIFICIEMSRTGVFTPHILASLKRMLLGIFFGTILAIPSGIILGSSKKNNFYIGDLFNFLYSVPKVVFLPIIIVLMGIKDVPKIFLIALIIFFQETVVIKDSCKNISKEFKEYFLTLNASKFQTIKYLLFPNSIPYIITSLRASLGIAISLLFISENFAAMSGIGYFVTKCMNERNYEMMYSAIIILAIIGVLLFDILDLIEKIITDKKFKSVNSNKKF